ncbi:MAG: hypothetical protein U0414_43740 [Polyangiaceae bacterium]
MTETSLFTRALVVAAIVAAPAVARGGDRRTMTLDYVVGDGATGCPSKEQVRARLVQEVGYDPIVEANPTLATTFEVTPDGSSFRGRYTARPTTGAPSSRDLSSDVSCDDLVSSFVLAAAISLDPEPMPPALPPPSEPKLVPVPVPVFIDRPVATPTPATPAPAPPVGVTFHAGYSFGSGLVPDIAHGPIAYVGLRGDIWEVGIEGAYVFEGNEASGFGDVLVSAALASLVPCFAPRFGARFRFFGCGNLALGGTFVDALNVDRAAPSTSPLALLGVRAGFGVHLAGPLEIQLLGDMLADLAPIDASIRDRGLVRSVYSAPAIFGRGILALALSFP